MRVLTVNAGSSSLKLRLLEQADATDTGFAVRAEYDDLDQAVSALDGHLPDGVGHRLVHGGPEVQAASRVDDAVLQALERVAPLAPLHQPTALEAVRRLSARWPGVPEVVCPDTAFHHDLPAAAATPAVPQAWRERWGLRRYGFHGLSVAGAVRRVRRLHPAARRVVVAHLGSGASLTAVADGRSVDTTMGFTPLDGLVMATRSGSLDPGMLLWLVRQGLDPAEAAHDLEQRSGLLALTGSSDMRDVLGRREAGDPRAVEGFAVYAHRLRAQLAAMVAALGGLDVLVLTGGVAERSATVRACAAEGLAHLGVRLDGEANDALEPPDDVADVTAAGSSSAVLVVAAREDVEIARETCAVLGGRPPA